MLTFTRLSFTKSYVFLLVGIPPPKVTYQGQNHERMLSFGLLDYRVTNQIYLGKQAAPTLANQIVSFDFRVWRCLFSELQIEKSDLSLL